MGTLLLAFVVNDWRTCLILGIINYVNVCHYNNLSCACSSECSFSGYCGTNDNTYSVGMCHTECATLNVSH